MIEVLLHFGAKFQRRIPGSKEEGTLQNKPPITVASSTKLTVKNEVSGAFATDPHLSTRGLPPNLSAVVQIMCISSAYRRRR